MLQDTTIIRQNYEGPSRKQGRPFTTFAFERHEGTTNIRIIGCFHLKPPDGVRSHIMGSIYFQGRTHPVMDRQILKGSQPTKITGESCIVLLNGDISLTSFGSAIMVNNVSEMLCLANDHTQQ